MHVLARNHATRASIAHAAFRGMTNQASYLQKILAETARVLKALASYWDAIEATVMAGNLSIDPSSGQAESCQLDAFVFRLLTPGLSSVLTQFLKTLAEHWHKKDARFVRSVVRIYSVLLADAAADDSQGNDEASVLKEEVDMSEVRAAQLKSCRDVFILFPSVALSELAEASDAVVVPVRLGLVLPDVGFASSGANGGAIGHGNVSDSKGAPKVRMDVSNTLSEYVAGLPPSPFAARQASLSSIRLTTAAAAERAERSERASASRRRGAHNQSTSRSTSAQASSSSRDRDARSEPPLSWAMGRYLRERSAAEEAAAAQHGPRHRGRSRGLEVLDKSSSHKDAVNVDADVSCQAGHLGRLWNRLVKSMVDLALEAQPGPIESSRQAGKSKEGGSMDSSLRDAFITMEMQLERTWVWLCTLLDSTEAQLRHGQAVIDDFPAQASGRSSPERALSPGVGPAAGVIESTSRPSSFLLSLLRAHAGEHGAQIPTFDVSATQHLAYIADGFAYYLQARRARRIEEPVFGQHSRFFVRSDSVCDGHQPMTFETPLSEALPLAERPDHLQPSSSKASLFGTPIREISEEEPLTFFGLSRRLTPAVHRRPAAEAQLLGGAVLGDNAHPHELVALSDATSDMFGHRWALASEAFIHMFLDNVGRERSSFLYNLAGFTARETRFRERIENLIRNLPENAQDLKFPEPLKRERHDLLVAVHAALTAHAKREGKRRLPLLCRDVKVEFAGEPGEGSGVVRSFLAAVCEALLQPEALPPSKHGAQRGKSMLAVDCGDGSPADMSFPVDGVFVQQDKPLLSSSADMVVEAGPAQPNGKESQSTSIRALFHSPGKPGYLTPVWLHGSDSDVRTMWFEHTGSLIGLALLHHNMFPITFSRHVLKHLLGREVGWHDLAFFDADMFETLRKAVVEANSSPKKFAEWGLTFEVSAPDWLGGAPHELVENGASVQVTHKNVHEYVALYAKFLLVDSIRPALDAMRKGLLQVVSSETLGGLSAEDLRLILNGTSEVDVSMLQRLTVFKNETSKDDFFVKQVQEWFWTIVSDMTEEQKHDLVSFWTSNSSLPATEAGLLPRPNVVVRPSSEGSAGMLPTAHTCSAQLSIPVYPSMEIMRTKLLTALSTKTFGFV